MLKPKKSNYVAALVLWAWLLVTLYACIFHSSIHCTVHYLNRCVGRRLKPTEDLVEGWCSGGLSFIILPRQRNKSDHNQLRPATTNTPVIRVLEHSDPGRELEPPSHLARHPRALPWQHASLRMRHDGQVTPILRAQTSQSARRPVGVEGIRVGGVAGIVHIV